MSSVRVSTTRISFLVCSLMRMSPGVAVPMRVLSLQISSVRNICCSELSMLRR